MRDVGRAHPDDEPLDELDLFVDEEAHIDHSVVFAPCERTNPASEHVRTLHESHVSTEDHHPPIGRRPAQFPAKSSVTHTLPSGSCATPSPTRMKRVPRRLSRGE